jgi:hypothetical protein
VFKQMYSESKFKLILIASNFDDGFSPSAVENARLLLTVRNGEGELDLKEAWKEATSWALSEDQTCNICRQHVPTYSEDIYFCTEESKENYLMKLPDFISDVISECGEETQYTRKNTCYKYARWKFKLCLECLESHKNNKTGNLKITLAEYYEHPLYKYYEALGFNRIKQNIQTQ